MNSSGGPMNRVSWVLKSVIWVVVGLTAPYILLALVDLLAIATGFNISAGFIKYGLPMWPGGEVIQGLVTDHSVSLWAVLKDLVQTMIVSFVLGLFPSLKASSSMRMSDDGLGRVSTYIPFGRYVGVTLLNACITGLVTALIGAICDFPRLLQYGVWGIFGIVPVLLFMIGVIYFFIRAMIRFKREKTISRFFFKMVIGLGQFACVTACLIVMSKYGVAVGWSAILWLMAHQVLSWVKNKVDE